MMNKYLASSIIKEIDYGYISYGNLHSNDDEGLKLIADALKKQIPKKPGVTDAYPHRVYCECGFIFAFNKDNAKVMGDLVQYDYCPCCGQKNDWSDCK